ncbi:MAG: fibronectin type III domain-containing protein, partial [Treponema sp.]|nr:fibronectin type III domain-containing protein [Treponema sp.]
CETGSDPDDTLPLAGPRSIQVTARDKALVLQWTKVAPAQGIIPYYEVYSGTGADSGNAAKWGNVESNTSNLVQAEITGLTNHQTYYVWVKAVYEGLGRSDFSPITYGTPIPPPAVPGALTVIPGEQILEVTWTAVEDAFTYEVYYQASGSGDTPPAETAETMLTLSEPGGVILGLTNGTAYTIWVRARNTAGDSPAYSKNTGTPQAATSAPASAPGKPEVTPGDGKLTLTWDQVSGVPEYKLYYGTTNSFSGAAEFPQTVPASAPRVSAELTGLANDTLYYVWVQSWNSKSTKDNSPHSEPVSGTPKAKDGIPFSNLQFMLGTATAEYIFAQDLPPSVFFPEGRPNTDRLTRVQETALGNLFTDGAAWYIRKTYPAENIDFVFLNGGYIDNALPAGTITVGSISAIVQPDSRKDTFILLTLTGAELKQFFNDAEGKKTNTEPGDVSGVVHTGRGGPHNTGFFGVVSKEVRYTLKYYKPPELADPPVEISYDDSEPYYHGFIDPEKGLTINGEPIDDSKNYRICTTDYLASGEYFVLLNTAGKDKKVIDTPFWHGVAEYIYDQGRVTPKLDGRIKVEGGVPLPAPWVPGNLIKP